MKILDTQKPILLSNAEVLAHLNDLDTIYEADARGSQVPETLQNVMRDVRSYLQIPTQPTSTKPQGSTGQESVPKYPNFSPDKFLVLAQRLKKPPFKLTPSEVLSVFNHVPRTLMELGMIIEEADIRYRRHHDERMNDMLKIIEDVLVKGVTDEASSRPIQTNGVSNHSAINGD